MFTGERFEWLVLGCVIAPFFVEFECFVEGGVRLDILPCEADRARVKPKHAHFALNHFQVVNCLLSVEVAMGLQKILLDPYGLTSVLFLVFTSRDRQRKRVILVDQVVGFFAQVLEGHRARIKPKLASVH